MTDSHATPDRPGYFLGRVQVLIERGPLDTPCHVWQGATMWGYALRRVDGIRKVEHRRVWENAHGEIPAGYDIHHICGQRRCINLEHLEMLTRSEHLKRHRNEPQPDGVARVLAKQTDLRNVAYAKPILSLTCPHGHAYTPENTRTVKTKGKPHRQCITCARARSWRKKVKA
jgi:hypothetical protein